MVDTETARRRSSRHSSVDSGSVLPKQCIFCNADKYVSASKTREVLTSCVQLRADDKIRRLARERFDSDILAVTSNELIAKEAHYHFSCYRDYVRVRPSSNENLPGSCTDTEQACEHDEDDDDLTDLFQCLNDLYQNPKYITLKSLQLLVKTESGKKNIRRTIERKTNDFVFVNCGRNVLVYPCSWKTEDVVSELYKTKMTLLKIGQDDESKLVCQSASIMRNEAKNIDYTMPWPPSPDDLSAVGFQIPKHLDLFLSVLLSGNIKSPSDRVNRLKLSFAQDVIYAGNCFILSLCLVYLN